MVVYYLRSARTKVEVSQRRGTWREDDQPRRTRGSGPRPRCNFASLWSFRFEIHKRWLHVIRRRSQRSRMTWELLEHWVAQWLPTPRILHPYPMVRFDAKNPR